MILCLAFTLRRPMVTTKWMNLRFYTFVCLGRQEENHEGLRIFGVVAEIWTNRMPDTSHKELWRCHQLSAQNRYMCGLRNLTPRLSKCKAFVGIWAQRLLEPPPPFATIGPFPNLENRLIKEWSSDKRCEWTCFKAHQYVDNTPQHMLQGTPGCRQHTPTLESTQ
jgi:hypothetical protein